MTVSRRTVLAAGAAAAFTAAANASLAKTAIAKTPKPAFDVIVVGGGSAGAVLATRLSADKSRKVLLIEAGPNFAPNAYPPVLANANIVAGSKDFDWNYHTDDVASIGHDIPVPRGKVIGGSSAVNAAVAMRARHTDFERWAKRGIEGWSWEEVLPFFRKLENTPTGEDEWHGRHGPFPIRQRTAAENTPSMRAFVEASQSAGLAHIADFNGRDQHGVGPYPLNVVDGVRVNTGIAYLTNEVRARPNLTIRAESEIDNIVVEGKRAVGVRLIGGEVVSGGEIILSAGTFGSPAILMRSGIGPDGHLSEMGIKTIADLPVGERLKDHPFFYNIYALKKEVNAMTPAAGAIIWTHSSLADKNELDLHISGTHLIDPKASPTGGALVLACAVTLPNSIGRLRLTSRDPRAMPDIQYNFFHDSKDLDRLVEAVKLSRQIGKTDPLAGMVDHEMTPGKELSDDELRKNIVTNAAAYLHPTSTVAMGAAGDKTAVVNPWGQVRGIEALRVVDASIIPDIPSVATNVTTIMVAERIAHKIVG